MRVQGIPWPIFLLGMGRSGSNLLEKILWGHPHINSLLPMVRGEDNHDDRAILDNLIRPKAWKLAYGKRWQMDSLSTEQLRKTRTAVQQFLIPGWRTFFRSSTFTKHTDQLAKLAPNARFIYLLRDPVATVCSLYDFVKKEGAKLAVTCQAHRYYLDWLRDGGWSGLAQDRVLVLRYEDLMKTPEPVVASAIRFMELNDQAPASSARLLCRRYTIRPRNTHNQQRAADLFGEARLAELRELLGYGEDDRTGAPAGR